jgi:hypothetical protein
MPKAKFLKPEKPIKFDEAMRKAMRVSPQPKKSKLKKVWRKKRR